MQTPASQQVNCPKNPDHGPVLMRWLPPAEREQIARIPEDDVYEVDCPQCGKYEHHDEHD
jgi:hypothetical protein